MTAAKAALRDRYRARRAALARSCPDFAEAIARFADALPIAKEAVVAFYWPMGDEADPRMLAQALAARGHGLALPVVVARDRPLLFRRWRPGDTLTAHRFGMNEPHSAAPDVKPDVLLVPLLAFDAHGHRLGYGGGFYDRTLAALTKARSVGVAYAGQETDDLPRQAHDHPLDMMVTENGLRRFANKPLSSRPSDA